MPSFVNHCTFHFYRRFAWDQKQCEKKWHIWINEAIESVCFRKMKTDANVCFSFIVPLFVTKPAVFCLRSILFVNNNESRFESIADRNPRSQHQQTSLTSPLTHPLRLLRLTKINKSFGIIHTHVHYFSLHFELWHLWLNSVFVVIFTVTTFMGGVVTFMGVCDTYGKLLDIYGSLWYLWELWHLWGVQRLLSVKWGNAEGIELKKMWKAF